MSRMWIPRVTYNPYDIGTVYDFTLPMQPWKMPSSRVGGSDESAAGVIVGYAIRTDRMATVTLRFLDAEYDSVMAMIEFLQNGQVFRFAFDKTNPVQYRFECRLVEPKIGTEVDPQRDEEYLEAWTQTIKFRSANGNRIFVPFYG